MKKNLLFIAIILCGNAVSAQKVDSIFFHLYTDSLKKCQHNYINVDGKLSNGNWKPLTNKDLTLSSADAKFEGTELVIPCDFKAEKVTVKAVLKSDPSVVIERTIWIKKLPDPDRLPTADEILNKKPKKSKSG
jgi:hypothetical protein